ncbi:phosphoribosyl-AMP cyclohydrolase [Limibacter armeniacum]|uniref:phosphoribosyl-AMP cyclohydrolase n=1 Tax=Limibacter armeniacum TaxID=466084 RepID=UPI002FE53AAF
MDIEVTLDLKLQFEKRGGLLPAVVQDTDTQKVLMLGYVNEEAITQSIKTGYATFYSTSRQELWTKGKTSGDLLAVTEILVDCDQDAVLMKVRTLGEGACHTKNKEGKHRESCFYRKLTDIERKRLSVVEGEE